MHEFGVIMMKELTFTQHIEAIIKSATTYNGKSNKRVTPKVLNVVKEILTRVHHITRT